MPYTPPSRSPAASAPTSPDTSRRPSMVSNNSRPSLPRSASYLTRHRRTPSAVGAAQHGGPTHQPTPEATSEDLKGMIANSNSIRQSPPPIIDDRAMPNGAIMSPPESPASSDEDEVPKGRGRRLENLRELQHAISQIPQHRESSPTRNNGGGAGPVKLVIPPKPDLADGLVHHSFSTGSLGDLAAAAAGRRISHSRSATDSDILGIKSADNSLSASDADSEEEVLLKKPQMVRKKSGELVRPALRPPSRRRPSSMPGTPTFSKAVHFDSHLEHVRHFLQVDRPLAVSAGSSPADNYGSDSEYPFPDGESAQSETRSPPFEWEIIMANFPVETPARKAQPVRLERVWLSNDQKSLIGSVVVANIAFQKYVTCRFTLDYWKTTSEVGAEYSAEIRPRENPVGHDRFTFNIKLSEVANLESKTLYFCTRYNVNGQELWDSNGGVNFQVDFRKKMLPQNGKRGFQGASARSAGELPRSQNRRANPSTAPRPKSMPVGISEFGGEEGKINFDQSIHDYLGETGPSALRLKGSKSTTALPSDNLSSRLTAPSGQAFANRYDFGASLSSAIQAAKTSIPKGDGLYMKGNVRQASPKLAATEAGPSATATNVANGAKTTVKDKDKDIAPAPSTTNHTSATATNPTGPSSLSSASYEELVNKYCFFGSKQSSPQLKDGTMRSGRFDGADDEFTLRGNNSSTDSSLTGSPLHIGTMKHIHLHGAQHHSLPKRDPNPYFQNASLSGYMGGSPAQFQFQQALERASSPMSPSSASQTSQPRSSASTTPTGPASSSIAAGSARSPSPNAMVGGFHPMTGTSSNEMHHYMHHDRFSFYGSETHASAAIRG